MIVLKNINGKVTVKGSFRGRSIEILPKHSYIIDSSDPIEDKLEAEYLTKTFGFVLDITQRVMEEGGVRRK